MASLREFAGSITKELAVGRSCGNRNYKWNTHIKSHTGWIFSAAPDPLFTHLHPVSRGSLLLWLPAGLSQWRINWERRRRVRSGYSFSCFPPYPVPLKWPCPITPHPMEARLIQLSPLGFQEPLFPLIPLCLWVMTTPHGQLQAAVTPICAPYLHNLSMYEEMLLKPFLVEILRQIKTLKGLCVQGKGSPGKM